MATRKDSGSASAAVMASTSGTLDSPVKQIQIEGLVSFTLVLCSCVLNFGSGLNENLPHKCYRIFRQMLMLS